MGGATERVAHLKDTDRKTKRETMPIQGNDYAPGKFVWFELITDDVEGDLAHYGEVLGWKTQSMDMGDFEYKMLGRGEVGHCGVVKPQMSGVPTHWASYLAVEDVDATVAKVAEAGGKVVVPPTDLPGVGRFSLIADPEGATVHAFKASGEGKASSGFHWNELWCQDPANTLKFYEKVFGATLEVNEMPFGPYYQLRIGDQLTGGAMKAPSPEIPAHWLPYAVVDDADAAAQRATNHGGQHHGEMMQVDGVGRFAVLASPRGAHLGVIKPA